MESKVTSLPYPLTLPYQNNHYGRGHSIWDIRVLLDWDSTF